MEKSPLCKWQTFVQLLLFIPSCSLQTKTMQNSLEHQYRWGRDWQGSRLAGKDLGITMNAGWICIQQYTSMANRQNLTLSYSRSSMTGRSSEVIISLCSELVRLHTEYWVQFSIPQRSVEKAERRLPYWLGHMRSGWGSCVWLVWQRCV